MLKKYKRHELTPLRQELLVHLRLRHPNILLCLGHILLPSCGCVLVESCRGSVAQLMQRGPVPLRAALSISVQVATALEYIHERQCRHGNFSAHCIYLTGGSLEGPTVKVGDFSRSRSITPGDPQEHYLLKAEIGDFTKCISGLLDAPSEAKADGDGLARQLAPILPLLASGLGPFSLRPTAREFAQLLTDVEAQYYGTDSSFFVLEPLQPLQPVEPVEPLERKEENTVGASGDSVEQRESHAAKITVQSVESAPAGDGGSPIHL
jgi:serine/threonine protein kinase